jgi:hypothetical protein
MIKNKKYWLIFSLTIVTTVLATFSLTTYNLNRSYADSISNSILYDLDGKFRILNKARHDPIDIKELKIMIERQIAGDLIVLSNIDPKIENLLGTPIATLQQAIDYEKTIGLLKSSNDKNDEGVRELAIRYIDKIKPDVEKETQKSKETIKKLGEHLREQFPSTKDVTK